MPSSASLLPCLDATANPVAQRGAILLVEDEEALADLLKHLLRRMNIPVWHAPTAAVALQLLEEHRREIVMAFVDCNLPDLPGPQLCELLRAATPGLPLLLTSGRDQHALERSFQAGGPCSFLPKPYLPTDVMGRITTLMPQAG